ncbi:MAG: GHMP kinase [Gemmatimonadota bacterium]
MLTARAPLRISFFGGGTDLPAYYRHDYGAVLSTAIDKYVYVTVKRHGDIFLEPFRLTYSVTELVDSLDEIKNDIAREGIRLLDVPPPLYVSTIADLPAASGLGSSSAFASALILALHTYQGRSVSSSRIAEEACRLEIDILGKPIGKQDQYASALGGVNFIRFDGDGSVTVRAMNLSPDQSQRLFGSLMLFFTGLTRSADTILARQSRDTGLNLPQLDRMRSQAEEFSELLARGEVDEATLGGMLDETWQIKRELAEGITNPLIDELYAKARKAGALGGKVTGAGGGGFLLLCVPEDSREAVREAMAPLSEVQFHADHTGATLL